MERDSPEPCFEEEPRSNSKRLPANANENREARRRPQSVTPAFSDIADYDESETKSHISSVTAYTDVVAIDKQKAWDDFESYLKSSFGSLVRAFDVMDTSGDGSIERGEWMNMVTRRLRYCRASEALRLFDSRVTAGNRISYDDLGITNQDWVIYLHEKRTKEQKIVNRNVQMKPQGFGGHGLRRELAAKDHDTRMKCKPKKPPEAFWSGLPNGWGIPPSYINFKAVTAESKRKAGYNGVLTARDATLPAFAAWEESSDRPQTAR